MAVTAMDDVTKNNIWIKFGRVAVEPAKWKKKIYTVLNIVTYIRKNEHALK